MTNNQIPEHYHIARYGKDLSPELTVFGQDGEWIVVDTWHDVCDEGGLLGKFRTLKEACEFADNKIKEVYPDTKPSYGAGFPKYWSQINP